MGCQKIVADQRFVTMEMRRVTAQVGLRERNNPVAGKTAGVSRSFFRSAHLRLSRREGIAIRGQNGCGYQAAQTDGIGWLALEETPQNNQLGAEHVAFDRSGPGRPALG